MAGPCVGKAAKLDKVLFEIRVEVMFQLPGQLLASPEYPRANLIPGTPEHLGDLVIAESGCYPQPECVRPLARQLADASINFRLQLCGFEAGIRSRLLSLL